MEEPQQLLTADQVAHWLGVGKKAIWEMTRTGELSVRAGFAITRATSKAGLCAAPPSAPSGSRSGWRDGDGGGVHRQEVGAVGARARARPRVRDEGHRTAREGFLGPRGLDAPGPEQPSEQGAHYRADTAARDRGRGPRGRRAAGRPRVPLWLLDRVSDGFRRMVLRTKQGVVCGPEPLSPTTRRTADIEIREGIWTGRRPHWVSQARVADGWWLGPSRYRRGDGQEDLAAPFVLLRGEVTATGPILRRRRGIGRHDSRTRPRSAARHRSAVKPHANSHQ